MSKVKFTIWKDGMSISIDKALEIMGEEGIIIYDPYGMYTKESPYYILRVCEWLKDEKLIDDYKVEGEFPPLPSVPNGAVE